MDRAARDEIRQRIDSSRPEDDDALPEVDTVALLDAIDSSEDRVVELEKLRDSMKYHLKCEMERVERVMARVTELEKDACNWPVYNSKHVTQEQFDAIVWEHEKMQERLDKLDEDHVKNEGSTP